ncbi:MAG TPA: alpha/beta fold hydrolase [Candidatus Synoicihabitans sp.]|nr:alpha/beta fold hydrolase [Candidatus Synoicihabitans sp.]
MPAPLAQAATPARDTVVLLHGLGLGSWAMRRIEWSLKREGYRVVNLAYRSRTVPIEELAREWLPAQLEARAVPLAAEGPRLHFVTHSMGGIVVRGWLAEHGPPPSLGRVVMIAPPNHGTTLVERIGTWWLFHLQTGVNGPRLGTGPDSFPRQLGPWTAPAPLGIIAGDRSINPLFSVYTGRPGDGKVTVASTRLDGMSAHLVLPHSHTWLQYRRSTIDHVRTFLRDGRFVDRAQ